MSDKNEEKIFQYKKINFRTIILAVTFLFVAVFLIRELFALQVIDEKNYKTLALNQQTNIDVIPAVRGNIYDRNHTVLAQSATTWSIVAAPNVVLANNKQANINLMAQKIANVLDMDAIDIINKITSTDDKGVPKNYASIKKQVEKPEVDELKAYLMENDMGGIYYEQDFKRYYPHDSLAASVIGFVNEEGGGSGLEMYYDKILSGVDGRKVQIESINGIQIPQSRSQEFLPEHGKSLVLTIDETIQRKVETILMKAIDENGVQNRGSVIVMNVNTGEIIAMASMPGFDPNDYLAIFDPKKVQEIEAMPQEERNDAVRDERIAQWSNKAVTEVYEPGSVFKIVTAASALDSGTSVLETPFVCTGEVRFTELDPNASQKDKDKDVIRCHNRAGHGSQNFIEAIMHSCNPATIEMGQRMGLSVFLKYYNAFGFSQRTGIDLPGEEYGITHKIEAINSFDFANMGFGQSIKVTPIQMITSVAAAVNGGYLVTPRVVSSIEDRDGNSIENFETDVKRQVISKETSQNIASILEQAVSQPTGSGRNAYVMGYRVGGKTGTSQKLDMLNEFGEVDKTISSFVGIAPADNPQYAILVLLDEPFDPNSYASTLAAPVVGRMFEDILPDLGIKPKYSQEELLEVDQEGMVPNVVNQNSLEAEGIIRNAGFRVKIVGDSGIIVNQMPPVGTTLKKDSLVVLYTETSKDDQKVALVPDVKGMGVKQAQYAFEAAGLNIKSKGDSTTGSGAVAASQSEAAGRKIPLGTVVEVEFLVYDKVM